MSNYSDNDKKSASSSEKPAPGKRLRELLSAMQEGDNATKPGDISLFSGNQEDGSGQVEERNLLSLPGQELSSVSYSGQSDGEEGALPAGKISQHPTGYPEQTGGWYGQGEMPTEPIATPFNVETMPVRSDSTDRLKDSTSEPSNSEGLADRRLLSDRVKQNERYTARVTPPTFTNPTRQIGASMLPPDILSTSRTPPASASQPSRYQPVSQTKTRATSVYDWGAVVGCLLRIIVVFMFVGVLSVLSVMSFAVYRYYSIARTLPDISDLRGRASQFETTRILDRNGGLLYEILDPTAGRRTYVPLEKISPYLIAATIATEDKEFYNHPGFDPVAILRAFWQNYTNQEIVSGASTITQQLARTLLLTPEERSQKTYERKAREIVLAAEITRRYTKDEILELYLNEVYYGNLAYGIEAAAETYFNTTADKLTLAQASFLAGLPQAPAVYDIFSNREETLQRHKQVLVLMYELSQAENCIEVSTQPQKICVDAYAATSAAQEIENYPFRRPQQTIRFPHWVHYVRSVLEQQFDAQTIYRSGFTVYTTIDPVLQEQAQQIVTQQVEALADRHATDGALVALRPSTGEILAMVGSADFYNEAISGEVNMAISPRQPGSSIKPITYTAAFEKGWTPATLIWDVPSEFPPSGDPNDPREPYRPVNYDGRFHGPVTVRVALANSYNVPAVKTLNFIGIYDNPQTPQEDGFLAMAKRMGITTLTRNDYGLSLTLGGGDVSLLELTGAYAIFANGGKRVPPVAITKIVDYQGNVVYQYTPPVGEQVIRPEHAYLITSILSDNEARAPMFGRNSVLNLPFPVAAKTGTTDDFRDNWTLGYTPDIAVGAWVGNADYTPMVNTTGLSGAAPIWSQFMQFAVQTLTNGNPTPFSRPAGIVDKVICAVSGTEPSEWCSVQRSEIFAVDQPPLPKKDDLWQKVQVDSWTGLKVSPYCADYVTEKFALNVTDPWAIKWIRETDQGRDWASANGFNEPIFFTPERECRADDPRPNIYFASPTDGQVIHSSPLDIYAVVYATRDFDDFRLEYGIGDDPAHWKALLKNVTKQYEKPERLITWDLKDVPPGKITLRIYMRSTRDTYAEKRIHLIMQHPTVTPTITVTPTLTPTETLTPIPTDTPTPIPSSTQTSTPTVTPP